MPIDQKKLIEVLDSMREEFIKDPENSIRSKRFISKMHEYCIYELKRLGINEKKVQIKPEPTIFTSHKPKDIDVAVIEEDNGPLIAISVKSQMSSIAKNFMGYYENLIGDVIGLHDKFPFLVVGMLYLLPLKIIRKNSEGKLRTESYDLVKIEELFRAVSNRKDWDDRPSKYEHFAMLIVDFEKDPPQIVNNIPVDKSLRIEDFFDKLLRTYKERNPFLRITKS